MPFINISVYWILWSMFLVIYYNPIMQFPNFSKNSLQPREKLTYHIIQPLFEIKIFCPNSIDFILKFFSSHFGRRVAWHDIIKSASYQTNNRQWQHDCKILQRRLSKDLSPKQLQTQDLRKQKSIKKISTWVEKDTRAQSLF